MLQKANCFLILMIMFCFGIIPSDLIRSITVLLLGRNARLDFWGKLLQFCLTRTQLSDQLSSCLFLRCSFSAHFFFLHSFAFIIHCLWSLHKIWGGLGKGFSWRFQSINNLLISAQFVGYDVGYRAVIALISVRFFTVYAANVPCLCLMPCLRLFVNFWQTPF